MQLGGGGSSGGGLLVLMAWHEQGWTAVVANERRRVQRCRAANDVGPKGGA
jgi:NAD(P)-dependent dehydrogenase (short-subunit alcohol dehydrogenase family)